MANPKKVRIAIRRAIRQREGRAIETSDAGVAPPIAFDARSSVPYYRQVYDGYRTAILSGRLRAGRRLPSTRALAEELGISRLPVVTAFEQLRHEGYVDGRVGSGTFVRASIPDHITHVAPGRTGDTPPIDGGTKHEDEPPPPDAMAPLRVSVPALDVFPHRIWARQVRRHADVSQPDLLSYGSPAGHRPLREAIADHVRTARAAECDPSQVIIVSGSQLALHLCARALLRPGDPVYMEEPGYPGARGALRMAGATVVPVPVDGEGIQVERMGRAAIAARLAYVTPSHQYPLGMTMSASRRLELLAWANERDAWIVEDDYDSEYRYASRPLGALQGMDGAERVIYIGTFSKVLFPSLRVGYLIVPHRMKRTFLAIREALDIFSPILHQLVLTDFLREGHFARHLRRMRMVHVERRDTLLAALATHARDRLRAGNAEAGLHIPAFLRDGTDDRWIEREAATHGLAPQALSACYDAPERVSGLILGFGGTRSERVDDAVRTLVGIIERAPGRVGGA